MEYKISPWPIAGSPARDDLERIMADEGLNPYSWSNGPHAVYAAHTHSYDKVIYVVSGSITFDLPDLGSKASLNPGDRLDLPAGIVHAATVSPEGVVCLEGHKVYIFHLIMSKG